MRSKFELQWLSQALTKESTATHIHWSVCRDAKCHYTLDISSLHNLPHVYH